MIKGLNINRIQNGRFMVVTTTVASWVVFHVGIELSHGFIKMIDIYIAFSMVLKSTKMKDIRIVNYAKK